MKAFFSLFSSSLLLNLIPIKDVPSATESYTLRFFVDFLFEFDILDGETSGAALWHIWDLLFMNLWGVTHF